MSNHKKPKEKPYVRRFSEGGDSGGEGGEGGEGGDSGSEGSTGGGLGMGGGLGLGMGGGLGLSASGTTAGGVASGLGSTGLGYSGRGGINSATTRANVISETFGVDPMDALMATTDGVGTMAPSGLTGSISIGGLGYAEAANLSALGYGNLAGINPNNPSQTVNQVLAANAVHGFLNKTLSLSNVATAIGGPIAGSIVSAMAALADGASIGDVTGALASGLVAQSLSNVLGFNVPTSAVSSAIAGEYGQAAMDVAVSGVAKAIGVSPSAVSAMAMGQFGQAAANMALGAIAGQTASALGMNPAIIGQAMNSLGISEAIGKPIGEVVGSLTADLGKTVSGLYGGIVGLKGEGVSLGQLGGLMGAAAQNAAPGTGGAFSPSGIAKSEGIAAPGIANAVSQQPALGGIAAILGARSMAKTVADKTEQAVQEKQRREAESRPRTQLFGSDIFGREQAYAGGGMVKRFADGGFSDEDLWFFDNSDLIFDSLPGVSGSSGMSDSDIYDLLNKQYEEENEDYGGPTNVWDTEPAEMDEGALTKLFGSLTSAAKSLFTKPDGSIDFAKLAAIGGGVLGYTSAKDQDLSGVGFQGQIPNLTAARAQVPYEYDEARRPGSYGRRYLSDMYYATPEDAAKIQQQALKQAQGIAALQRADGSMSTSIAPGGIGGAKPKPAPAPAPEAPTAPTAPEPLYKSLTASSTPEQIAAAYKQWAGGLGGDTEANRAEAAKFLSGIGVTPQTINRAYDTYKGVQLDQYKGLTGQSSAKDIARAYNQWIGTTPDLGDVQANQDVAANYLRNLGLSDTAIQQAYEVYKNKQFAAGGIASLAKGGAARQPRYLDGATNGQADQIETTIDGEQPALLSHGEFVIPADIVSALGGGNSKAGAETLYDMMDRVRQQAFGRKKQMSPVDPNKVMPV